MKEKMIEFIRNALTVIGLLLIIIAIILAIVSEFMPVTEFNWSGLGSILLTIVAFGMFFIAGAM